MTDELRDRFFGVFSSGLDPVSQALLIGIASVLAVAGVITFALPASRVPGPMRRELRQRWTTWAIIAPIVVAGILCGAGATALLIAAISLLGYREFARGTGLFRDPIISGVFVLAVLALAFGALDNRFAQFTAVAPIATVLIAIARLLRDDPEGYLQSVSLGVVAVLMLAVGPAYLTMFTIDERAIPVLLTIFVSTAVGDVSAFIVGKCIKGPKLAPNTSPGKTISGAVGSLVITASFAAFVFGSIYDGTPLDTPLRLAVLGVLIAACGQLGDLVLSSIKRDLGIKDFGASLPGHGGLLDRVDSLLLSSPAAFYFIANYAGVGINSATEIFTG